MRITNLNVDGFGVWNSLELSDLSEISVFYGPNDLYLAWRIPGPKRIIDSHIARTRMVVSRGIAAGWATGATIRRAERGPSQKS